MASPIASTSATTLPSWPPILTAAQLSSLTAEATDYALSHGLVYRPAGSPPQSTHVHHAPISLLPSPFPRPAFQQALRIQAILNELYARVAVDGHFLEKVIGKMVAPVDEFTRGLWDVYTKAKQQGTSSTYHLGLFRSDYLLHASEHGQPSIRQVEFNTISSSFGALCQRVSELHRSLLMQTDYYHAAPDHLKLSNMPRNTALTLLSDGLAQAHKAYLAESGDQQTEPRILFVVQERERNAFDQRWLEYELLHTHGIRSTRRTFTSLISSASRDPSSGALHLSSETSSATTQVSVVYFRAGYTPTDYPTPQHWDLRLKLESTRAIKCPSVALQLAGAKKVQQVLAEPGVLETFLSPTYPASAIQALRDTWAELYPLDSSPLGEEGQRLAMEEPFRFVMKPQREGGGNNIYREDIPPALRDMLLRDSQRSADVGSEQGAGVAREQEGYILMELIVPPEGLGNYLLRAPAPAPAPASVSTDHAHGENPLPDPPLPLSTTTQAEHPEGLQSAECTLSSDVVSELGIYGVALFRSLEEKEGGGGGRGGGEGGLDEKTYWSLPLSQSSKAQAQAQNEVELEVEVETEETETEIKEAAYLLRTKARESDEGGVAVGFSVLDSVLLL